MSHDDFAFEPIKGLPEVPPKDERILWRGTPQWQHLALRAFYVRPVAIYFGILMVWRLGEALLAGGSPLAAIAFAIELAPIGAAALGLLMVFAWAYARSTVYTLTSQRLVIRSGVALPITVNIPYAAIKSADLRVFNDGTGDIPLTLVDKQQASFFALWPHIRPWHFGRTVPMIRSVAAPEIVGKTLAKALAATQPMVPAKQVKTPAGLAPVPTNEAASGDKHLTPPLQEAMS